MNLPYPRPIDTLPTVVLGFVWGKLRLERRDGRVAIMFRRFTELFWRTPIGGYAVTHLQKYSRFGVLLTWPFCFHVWVTFKFQEGHEGDWIPGSEKVFYARTPGYRFDTDYGMKWTWGYIGLHWD